MCFQKFPGQWHHEKNACLLLPRQVLGEVRRFTLLCFASSGEVRHSRLNFSENYSNSSAVQRCNCTFKALQEVAWFADTSDRSQHPLQCSHFYKPMMYVGGFGCWERLFIWPVVPWATPQLGKVSAQRGYCHCKVAHELLAIEFLQLSIH